MFLISTCLAKKDNADADGLEYKQNNYMFLSPHYYRLKTNHKSFENAMFMFLGKLINITNT
jgi:hypothetical protein